jgi:hypothetical protein
MYRINITYCKPTKSQTVAGNYVTKKLDRSTPTPLPHYQQQYLTMKQPLLMPQQMQHLQVVGIDYPSMVQWYGLDSS